MKFVFTSLLFSFTTIAFAQVVGCVNMDSLKKWAIGINVNSIEPASDAGFDYNALSQRTFVNGHRKDNSYCVGLYISYKIKENCALRLSAKITNYKISERRDYREFVPTPQTTGSYQTSALDVKQSVLTISPGILWSGNYNKKLNFYGGFQLVYRKYSSIIGNSYDKDFNYPNNTLTFDRWVYQTEPGGFSIGAGPIAGFSIKLFKCISIGAEFSTAYSYYKTGGAITTTTTFYLPNNGTQPAEVFGQEWQGYRFSSLLSAINLSIGF